MTRLELSIPNSSCAPNSAGIMGRHKPALMGAPHRIEEGNRPDIMGGDWPRQKLPSVDINPSRTAPTVFVDRQLEISVDFLQ